LPQPKPQGPFHSADMHYTVLLATLLCGIRWAQAKLVFAHFMV
jgi:hypothetical protein